MCTGRVDLAYVLRAFLKGIDGVFIGVCHLGECHYITVLASYSVCKVNERKVYGVWGMYPGLYVWCRRVSLYTTSLKAGLILFQLKHYTDYELLSQIEAVPNL